MDIDLVISEYDDFVARREYAEGGEFLKLAAEAARLEGDLSSELAISNELIGHCRKNDDREGCFEAIKRTVELIALTDTGSEPSAGTAYINIGTGYTRFGEPKLALTYFTKAEKIYRETLGARDARWGALYNNTATALQDAGEYGEAEKQYLKAAKLMSALDKSDDEAVTYVNMAHLAEVSGGSGERISEYLDRAYYLLGTVREKGAYHAFVCAKCAPSFKHFGDERRAAELSERAEMIYDAIGGK